MVIAHYMMEDGATPYEQIELFDFDTQWALSKFDLAGGDIGWAKKKKTIKIKIHKFVMLTYRSL